MIKRITIIAGLTGVVTMQAQHQCALAKVNGTNHTQVVTMGQKALEDQYDAKYYHLDINAERDSKFISGNVHSLQQVIVPSMDTFMVELHNTMTIDSARINGDLITAVRDGDAAYFILPASLSNGSMIDAVIYYQGTTPTINGSAIGDGYNKGTSGSWGNQVSWSLSEPYAAYEWFPCKQALTDKLDSTKVYVTTDSTNKVGSNGLLKNVVTVGSKKRHEWVNTHVIDYYLISIAVAQYVEYTFYAHPAGTTDSIMIQNYVYNNPATLSYFQSTIDQTAELIEYFSDVYSMYPFADEKYGHSMAPFGGGMEHQTMTSLGSFDFTLIAHEMGHQWFGDNITCKTWGDIAINEGFATYTEQLALEHFDPSNAPQNMQSMHTHVMSSAGGSVFCTDTTNINAIFDSRLVYDKGGAVLHTLRFVCNSDSLFFVICKTMQSQFHNSTASLMDLKAVSENVTGLDLTQFFNQWIYGEGYPTFNVQWNQVGNTFIIQDNETVSKSSVTPVFITPLEYKLTRSIGDTIIKLDQNQNLEYYELTIPGTVTAVTVDPNNWIINKDQVTHNTNLTGIKQLGQLQSVSVYPNPASNSLSIKCEKADYMIIDITGKQLMNGKVEGSTTVDISSLSGGMYFIKLGNNADAKMLKFVKQ